MKTLEQIYKEVESVPDYAGHKITHINYTNAYGDTPLHIACCWGNTEAVTLLISSGADINIQGETGFTPLHYAVEQDHPKAVTLLLKSGAKLLKNNNGVTPLELANILCSNKVINAFNTNI